MLLHPQPTDPISYRCGMRLTAGAWAQVRDACLCSAWQDNGRHLCPQTNTRTPLLSVLGPLAAPSVLPRHSWGGRQRGTGTPWGGPALSFPAELAALPFGSPAAGTMEVVGAFRALVAWEGRCESGVWVVGWWPELGSGLCSCHCSVCPLLWRTSRREQGTRDNRATTRTNTAPNLTNKETLPEACLLVWTPPSVYSDGPHIRRMLCRPVRGPVWPGKKPRGTNAGSG